VSQKVLDYDLFNIIDAAMKHDYVHYDQNQIIKYLVGNLTREVNWLPAEKHHLSNYVRKLIRGADVKNKNGSLKYNLDYPSTHMFFKQLANSALTITYVCTKLLYLANAFLQLYLMNVFLSNKHSTYYGGQVLATIWRGEADLGGASDSKIFPRITICDVKTKELGTDHLHTVQCVLSFNLFNERIYAFLWFWIFCVVVPFTLFDLLSWINRVILFGSYFRFKFLLNHIRILNPNLSERDKFLIKLFSEYYLGNNGIFCLRLIEHNSNSIVVAELVDSMWKKFKVDQDQ
jgi:hypothetical protein